jgi:hypothetical protein
VRGSQAHLGHWGNDLTGATVLSTGVWCHVTWLYEAGQQSIYVNGKRDVGPLVRGMLGNVGNGIIGNASPANWGFTSLLDEVCIFDGALNFGQIRALASGARATALPAPRRGAKPSNGITSRGHAEYRAPLATLALPLRGGSIPHTFYGGLTFWFPGEVKIESAEGLVRRDETGEFNVIQAGRKVKGTYRKVVIWLEDKQETMALLTNRLDLPAEAIAEIYKQRWQIELFFKAIKQNLRIKTFVGTSANAVRIQIWMSLIAFLLLKMLQFRSKKAWTLSTLVALLRWNLFTHKNLWTWLEDPEAIPPDDPPSESHPIQPVLDGIFGPAPHLTPAN